MKSIVAIGLMISVMAFNFAQNDSHVVIKKDVTIANYFQYMDSLVNKFDSLCLFPINEHLIVRNNPWIIEKLANTDYYRMMARDSFIYDQREMVILKKNDTLKIPGLQKALKIDSIFQRTHIDVNIPEFKLRIFLDNMMLHEFPIRVGQNRKRFLEMNQRMTDLKTQTGTGTIIRHSRDPDYYNPVDGKQFYFTKRDDDRVTHMPIIPWIETRIDDIQNGQMIHPTTNPDTLGKAYSNGCIGTREADAWIIYYYAPIGTAITIRYDLDISDGNGNMLKLEDIYDYRPNR
ncbi:MAG: L,D-transpeptidase [Bacteroidia bacterium]|nr:L,D-transpeptidase [Bacteroidia bacterium]MBT8268987.1 L,D-transpeptidase [Bacteroidia bacterium]NNF83296.1 L,D-transpeptidase [Flavobacteriaceae bacterium]